MNYIFYSIICFMATSLGAISGIGEGVFIKPIFDPSTSLTVSQISFLSSCSVLAMSIVTLLSSRGGEAKIDFKITTPLAIGSAFGGVRGFVGRKINKKMSSKAVDILLRCMLVAIICTSIYNLTKYIFLI